MRGRSKIKRVEILPDKKYKSLVVARFINKILAAGKKQTAEAIVYTSLTVLEEKTKKNALESFEVVINNVKPILEVRSKRIGGATYQVPVEVPTMRAEALAMRWLIEAARNKKGKPMSDKLAQELLDAYKKEGTAMRKRENVHKMAEANKAFAHFARF